MAQSIPFGSRSTADQVLAGVDLTRKRIVVIGCDCGIGFEALKSFVANGAHVIGLAPTLEGARAACQAAGSPSTPMACDLADLASIDAAADSIGKLPGPLDAILTNPDPADPAVPAGRHGIELRRIAEYVGHFALVNRLIDRVRSNGGRIVVASNEATVNAAPIEAVRFDALDDRRFYESLVSLGQAKSANAIYAKELARRLAPRGVSVNSFDSPSIGRARRGKQRGWARRFVHSAARWFMKSDAQRAATAALLAASPLLAGTSGEHWANCRMTPADPVLADEILAKRVWETSEQTVAALRTAHRIAPEWLPASPSRSVAVGHSREHRSEMHLK
jgi:NAD(P)-dependent dehydrogenase (short-subunit alcohol dehydrogenase family)